jgi:hypothetical protein
LNFGLQVHTSFFSYQRGIAQATQTEKTTRKSQQRIWRLLRSQNLPRQGLTPGRYSNLDFLDELMIGSDSVVEPDPSIVQESELSTSLLI